MKVPARMTLAKQVMADASVKKEIDDYIVSLKHRGIRSLKLRDTTRAFLMTIQSEIMNRISTATGIKLAVLIWSALNTILPVIKEVFDVKIKAGHQKRTHGDLAHAA